MYLSNKLFRSAQPSLNLNLPHASTSHEPPVCLHIFNVFSRFSSSLFLHSFQCLSSHLQVPEVLVTAESSIPRDASGAIDHQALAQLLKDMHSLQDQADILYILYKDK